MYNIAITKDKETKFFDGADGKPRPYPTLADALVSAQYLGLTRQDVELHFVREGASAEAVTRTVTAVTPQGPEGGAGGNPKPLEKMAKEQLIAYAAEAGITVSADGTKAETLAAIQAALEIKAGETPQGGGNPPG